MLAVLAALLVVVLLLGGASVLLLCVAATELGRVRAAVEAARHTPPAYATLSLTGGTPRAPEPERPAGSAFAPAPPRGVT